MRRYAISILSISLGLAAIGPIHAQETGYIKAHGKPGDAGVFINGQYVGPAVRFTVPEKYPAPAGEVEIAFKDPRYEDFITKVTVRPKKTTKIKYALEAGRAGQTTVRPVPAGWRRARFLYVHRGRRHRRRLHQRQVLRPRG